MSGSVRLCLWTVRYHVGPNTWFTTSCASLAMSGRACGPFVLPREPFMRYEWIRGATRPTYSRMRRRIPFLAKAGLVAVVACHPPRAAQLLQVANPGATFEVRLDGCSTRGETGRRFGRDVRAALLWSSERIHSATYLPCTATVHAVRDGQRRPVYRVSRTREGAYSEALLHPQP